MDALLALARAPEWRALLFDAAAGLDDLAPLRRALRDLNMARASPDAVLLRRFLLARARLGTPALRSGRADAHTLPPFSHDDRSALAAWRSSAPSSGVVQLARDLMLPLDLAAPIQEKEEEEEEKGGDVAIFRAPPKLPRIALQATEARRAVVTARVFLQAHFVDRPRALQHWRVAQPIQLPPASDFTPDGVQLCATTRPSGARCTSRC
jgi:hypothetical protein